MVHGDVLSSIAERLKKRKTLCTFYGRSRKKIPATAMTVGEWFTEWLSLIETTRRSTTHLRYKRLLDRFAKPLHRKKLNALEAYDLRTFYDSIKTTVHEKYGLHTVIKSCLMEAWRRQYIDENPARRVQVPRPEPAEVPSRFHNRSGEGVS